MDATLHAKVTSLLTIEPLTRGERLFQEIRDSREYRARLARRQAIHRTEAVSRRYRRSRLSAAGRSIRRAWAAFLRTAAEQN